MSSCKFPSPCWELIRYGILIILFVTHSFNDTMRKAPAWKVAFALGVTMLGAAIMSLVRLQSPTKGI